MEFQAFGQGVWSSARDVKQGEGICQEHGPDAFSLLSVFTHQRIPLYVRAFQRWPKTLTLKSFVKFGDLRPLAYWYVQGYGWAVCPLLAPRVCSPPLMKREKALFLKRS